MARSVVVEVELPGDMRLFRFPKALDRRLQDLLDKRDRGARLTVAERKEAEGLVRVMETLCLLKLRAESASGRVPR
ncbi:MAG TPA: hypothetical protein VKA46_36300 [Gemmataceae bacterium]|nr:hypothetical protein [Gemmataceae bacterium]